MDSCLIWYTMSKSSFEFIFSFGFFPIYVRAFLPGPEYGFRFHSIEKFLRA